MHETSEINGLYVDRCLLMQQAVPAAKSKRKIQRFYSPQCMNNHHCNEDKDALNRFADKSEMTRQHGKTNSERRAETLSPSPLTRTVIA